MSWLEFHRRLRLTNLVGFWLLSLSLITTASPSMAADQQDHAKIVSYSIPKHFISGEQYPIVIELKNAGSTSWTTEEGYSFDWAGDEMKKKWGTINGALKPDQAVNPGQTVSFEFNITAPPETGQTRLAWQMKKNGKGFGEIIEAGQLQVESPTNRAHLVSQLVPDNVQTGEHFTVVFQYQNIGKTTWNRENGYYLAAVDAEPWDIRRVDLPKDSYITPNETVTFRFDVTAPLTGGDYNFQWQMHQKRTPFGESMPVKITVQGYEAPPNDSEFVFQDVPAQMVPDREYLVSVQFKNTGDTAWTPGQYQLGSMNPQDNLVWAIDRVDLTKIVRPGEFYTFRFKVRAPNEPGRYSFQWSLIHLAVGAFGSKSDHLDIEVKSKP